MRKKVVLAYSGGLDTTVCVKWLQEKYDADVVTLTVDLGQGGDMEKARQRALSIGAVEAIVIDGKEDFAEFLVLPALQANALYEGVYPLATALARPLIAYYLVKAAHEQGASAVAHGCTGKGNDQVRFELSVMGLDPKLEVIAPVREWSMTRDQEIEFLKERGIAPETKLDSRYSVDANLWGRSIEAGELEDPNVEPLEEVYEWTQPVEKTPSEPEYLEIQFERGVPIALDGESTRGAAMIEKLNAIGGKHGVGRIDHVENRLVGIKTREIYEAPAAVILLAAHAALEGLVLSKETSRFKQQVTNAFSDLIYNGGRFSAFYKDLMAFIVSTQEFVSGTVRIKLHHGNARVVGREAPFSLYQKELATYETGDQFDHSAAVGFIKVFGMSQVNQTAQQLLPQGNVMQQLSPTNDLSLDV